MGQNNSDKWLTIGVIGRAFGVKGWLHIRSDMEVPDDILSFELWRLVWPNGEIREVKLLQGRSHGTEGVVAYLEGCNDRDEAKRWTGAKVQVQRSALPEPEAEDAFYWTDLEGFEVLNEQGHVLGTVMRFFFNGAHDVVVLDNHKMLPFVMEDTVRTVDLAARRIVMDWQTDDA